MHFSLPNWRIIDYESKNLNCYTYTSSTSDEIFNITLKCELDLTIFVKILEVFVPKLFANAKVKNNFKQTFRDISNKVKVEPVHWGRYVYRGIFIERGHVYL